MNDWRAYRLPDLAREMAAAGVSRFEWEGERVLIEFFERGAEPPPPEREKPAAADDGREDAIDLALNGPPPLDDVDGAGA